jgi:hypothetical protein
VGEEGDVLFTNRVWDLPPDTAHRTWTPILPGHYVCGKDPVLKQVSVAWP